MPLVRVDVPKGNSAEYRRAIGDEIYTAMMGNWSCGDGEAQYAP
jgi:hypothetical protein